jgi:exodeoxyribonuclease (lambda-induced)
MIEQYSSEWFAQRMGKLTSSTIYNLMTEPKLKSEAGQLSATTKEYLTSKLAERLTGVQREFTSNATNHGLELENEAIRFYEGKTGNKVIPSGYIESISGLYGGTPDGLIEGGGIVQIKCPYQYSNHINNGCIDSQEYFKKNYKQYYWQCQSDMIVTESEFCDYVSYCPQIADNLKMFIFRLEANVADMELLLQRISMAGEYINNLFNQISNER